MQMRMIECVCTCRLGGKKEKTWPWSAGVSPRFEPRWQYKAGDITLVGCDYDAMLTPPFGNSAEQIEATSWFRQNYASTGPLTGRGV